MNMATTNKEQTSFEIAAISGAAKNSFVDVLMDSQLVYRLEWDGPRAIVSAPGWDDASWSDRLSLTQGALALFNCLPIGADVQLLWMFSGKLLNRAESTSMMDRWIEENAPPVMDFIDLVAEDEGVGRWVRTFGLFPIVGHEIETFIDRTSSHEHPRFVGYLAQEALRSGPIRFTEAVGPDGTEYRLKRSAESARYPSMIRIIP